MNVKIISAFVLATVIAAPAFADGEPHYPEQAVAAAAQPSGLTRAQVRAELVQLEKAGYRVGDGDGDQANYPVAIQAAEARVAAQNGGASDVGGEVSGSSASGAPAAVHSSEIVGLKPIYFGS